MDESTERRKEENNPGEVDLSGLEGFNFASNWAEAAAVPGTREKKGQSHPRGQGHPRKTRPPDRRRRFDRDKSDAVRGDDPGSHRPRPPSGGNSAPFRSGDRRPAKRSHDGPRPERRAAPEFPFEIQVVPEDTILAALTKRMRASLRTYELFELARLILEKPERFHLSIRPREGEGESALAFFISVPDHHPFMDEAKAVDHVLLKHGDKFFKTEEVEAEPPKGNFQYVMRCPQTGEILGPPNFHRYQSTLVHYHQEHFPNVPFEKFRSGLETVQDEEAVKEWIQGMTRVTRYTPILPDGTTGEPCEGLEAARDYLLSHHKERAVRPAKTIRVAGVDVSSLTDERIREALEYHVSFQQRFPLDSANHLRRRLRRQNFYIYKRGSKGISYVCAVKRRFREPAQVFSDSLQELIAFLDRNPMIPASELPEKFLGMPLPPAETENQDQGAREADPRMKRLMIDLRWLLSEGYVTEYSDGRLVVHPVQQPARPGKTEGAAGKKASAEPEQEPEVAAERALTGDPDPPASDVPPGTESPPPLTPETEPAGRPFTPDESTPPSEQPSGSDGTVEARPQEAKDDESPKEESRKDESSDEIEAAEERARTR